MPPPARNDQDLILGLDDVDLTGSGSPPRGVDGGRDDEGGSAPAVVGKKGKKDSKKKGVKKEKGRKVARSPARVVEEGQEGVVDAVPDAEGVILGEEAAGRDLGFEDGGEAVGVEGMMFQPTMDFGTEGLDGDEFGSANGAYGRRKSKTNTARQPENDYEGDGWDTELTNGFQEQERAESPDRRKADEFVQPARKSKPAPAESAVSPRPSPRPAPARPVVGSVSPALRHATPYGQAEPPAGANGYRRQSVTRRESYTSRASPSQRYVEPVARTSPSQRYVEPATRVSPNQRFVEPVAPPHMPQPHFYGLPDFGLNMASKKEQAATAAGSDGYCCCFDTFADSGDSTSSTRAKTALLVGSEGGLEVFRVLPNKFEVIGRLEGLRGSVVGAKILPQTCLEDPMESIRPLVAVVVHGATDGGNGHSASGDRRAASAAAARYQTTVEVYSLQTQEHVATLYRSHTVAAEQPTVGHLSTTPGPVGDLRISAYGKFVTIASGKSGEVFVFSHVSNDANQPPGFRCIGKFWTSLQSSLDRPASRPATADGAETTEDGDRKPGVPLLSLSQRWLAIVPPATASQVSIQGTPLVLDLNPAPPGLASHGAPPQPSITCDTAGVDAEGTWSRLSRQAAQGVVRYSQKGLEIGWQGWNELVNPTNQTAQHGRTASREDHFPPTKAPPDDPRRQTREPAVVSIIDLETLLEAEELKLKYPPAPMATFALEEGCNHLSISSNGLRLLTVNRTGEASAIWDLKQARHGTVDYAAPEKDDGAICSPCVKQIIRIPRSSQSVVVESAWSRDDEYLAMLTTHGTVHLHEVPATAPSRKRKRKSTITNPAPEKAQATVSVSQGMSPPSNPGFLGSLRSGFHQVRTQAGTIRANNPVSLGMPTLAGLRETAASTGHAGGRFLAKGLSQGLSAAKSGANEYWHSEDNKIRHKALQGASSDASLRWVKRQSGTLLAVAAGGTVHLHPISQTEYRRGDKLVTGLKHDKHQKKHFELPPIRAGKDSSQARRADDCTAAGPHGFWSLRPASPPPLPQQNTYKPSQPLQQSGSQANEVETNPPYCPFHVDSRVSIFAFDDSSPGSQINLRARNKPRSTFFTQGQAGDSNDRWIFGGPLPASTKLNTHDALPLDEFAAFGLDDADLEAVAEQVESRLTAKWSYLGGSDHANANNGLKK
ncbi:uncharacterized protein LTR77_011012 [Saxophila tyrrhenica]|uniref:Uncharacterized protein n=1 Tax=Saxophila tyrrhenica TaxID=1690608 RepID=A0AAV9NU86_9PEZI|nr:hypothetical protein LTR77_011012 [Saxophila tyrrhenica]